MVPKCFLCFYLRSTGDDSKSLLRRSCGSQNLLTVDKVFSEGDHAAVFRQLSEPTHSSRSVPSSPRIARPPAKESHHVNRMETEVRLLRELAIGA
jgi:hypothetical protein